MPGNKTPTRTWRIAFLRRRFSPTGGAERYLLRLASGLAARGHQITLYCEEWSPRENPFQEVRKIDSDDPVSFAAKVHLQPLRNRHDVIFSLERVPNCDIYRAGDGLHADWLAYRQAFHPVMGKVRTLLRSKNRQLCELEARVFAPGGVRRVICNSRFVADQVVKRFNFSPDRIDVIYNGVPYQQFSMGDRELGRRALQLGPDDYVVLLVGAGAERKGHAIARGAMRHIKKKYAKLLIIDSPPPVAMPHVYAAADVFLLPTLYDPFANVTLEALAAGLPVITSAQNGASEIIEDDKSGFILPRADDDKLIVHLLDYLSEPAHRARFRQPAQALAQKYDLAKNLNATLAVFDKLTK
ncbi:MAG: glycosyltransferase family 4 protein [Methylacidiphilales bacterium]|nr:glycosyltransferase family 4 protein [Candidatus Methylacidiphilales bacterium]